MVAKYGLNSYWDPKEVQDAHGRGIWKAIKRKDFKLGLGEEIRFWKDIWCGNNPF